MSGDLGRNNALSGAESSGFRRWLNFVGVVGRFVMLGGDGLRGCGVGVEVMGGMAAMVSLSLLAPLRGRGFGACGINASSLGCFPGSCGWFVEE